MTKEEQSRYTIDNILSVLNFQKINRQCLLLKIANFSTVRL